MIRTECPACGAGYDVPPLALGRHTSCKNCGDRFAIAPAKSTTQVPTGERAKRPHPRSYARPVAVSREFPDDDFSTPPRSRGFSALWLIALVAVAGALPAIGCLAIVCVAAISALGSNANVTFSTVGSAVGTAGPGAGTGPAPDRTTKPSGGLPGVGRAIAPKESVVRDDLIVSITGAIVDQVPLRSMFDEHEVSTNQLLVISVKLSTDDETKKFNYRTWTGNLFVSHADLTDNFGNRYKAISFGTSDPVGQIRSGSVTARSSLTDVMVFEKPLPTVEYLDLDLPGSNAGVSGTLRFRIPRAVWSR